MSTFWILPLSLLRMLAVAVCTGKIKSRSGYLASRKDRPQEYWFWVVFLATVNALPAFGASTMPKDS